MHGKLPMPGWKFAVTTMVLLGIAFPLPYALHMASLHADPNNPIPYVVGFVAGQESKYALPSIAAALIAFGLSKLRLREPGKWPLRIGTIFYWLGATIGLGLLALAIVLAISARSDEVDQIALLSDVIRILIVAFACWFTARGIRYVLGR